MANLIEEINENTSKIKKHGATLLKEIITKYLTNAEFQKYGNSIKRTC